MIPLSNADYLVALAEPTRLRVLNCVAAAPLFVSDLVAILGLPQPTVSRHLKVLRDLDAVRVTPIPPYVLYRLALVPGMRGRLLRSVLDAVRADPAARLERGIALNCSREAAHIRVAEGDADAG
jgi:ArsR family transcriptional regulator